MQEDQYQYKIDKLHYICFICCPFNNLIIINLTYEILHIPLPTPLSDTPEIYASI